MDAEQWRAELRTFIAEEVRQYLSTYRGAGTAELSRVGAELTSEMTRIAANLAKKREELVAALAVPGQVDHVVRTWGRAIFTGAFMLAGILGAAWLALAWTEQQFRWQVAKNAEIEERIAAQDASWISSTEGPAAFHCPARTVTDIVLSCFLMMLM